MGPRELESLTSCVSSRRSNQLSYGPEEGISQFNMWHDSRTHKMRQSGRRKVDKTPIILEFVEDSNVAVEGIRRLPERC